MNNNKEDISKDKTLWERINTVFKNPETRIDKTIQELDRLGKERGLPTYNDFKDKFEREK